MLGNRDVRALAKGVDKALRQLPKQRERLLAAYVARKTSLQDAATEGGDAEDTLPAQSAWAVLDATWAAYEQLAAAGAEVAARTKAALLRLDFEALPKNATIATNAPPAPRLDLAFGHMLAFKYVQDAGLLLSLGATLEEIYLTGSSKEARARLKRLLEVGSKVAIDEAMRYSGIETLEGLMKLLEAASGTVDALRAPRRTRADAARWRRAVRLAQFSLSAWLEQALPRLVEWRQRLAVAGA